ncbi:uncharacterized protein VTP21DRAFT_6481 [Calcarisporiella thermophila]|uniref:uncharacterized protein n=1 Tax=Calcarisporiella thermophila TaxID=911321 RepID=UPI003741EB3A
MWIQELKNIPTTTRLIILAILILSSLGAIDKIRSYLIVVPGSFLWSPWTILSTGFLEKHIITFFINTISTAVCGSYLERAWGSRQFFIFIFVVNSVSVLLAWIVSLIEFIIFQNADNLYSTQIGGGAALISGYLVSLKQLIPEHLVTIFGVLRLRVKYFPLIYLLSLTIACVIFPIQPEFFLALFGWLTSWMYIRFFKYQDGILGDRSETFSFASFFPKVIQPPIKMISNLTYGILVSLRCCPPISSSSQPFNINRSSDLPQNTQGTAWSEIERQKALALRTLDMRLHAAQQQRQNQQKEEPEGSDEGATTVLFDSAENANREIS